MALAVALPAVAVALLNIVAVAVVAVVGMFLEVVGERFQ